MYDSSLSIESSVRAILLIASTALPGPVAAAGSPSLSDQPTAAQIQATIENFLAERTARITGEAAVASGKGLGFAQGLISALPDQLAVLDARRAAIQKDRIEYTQPMTEVTLGWVTRSGDTLTVTASELTTLHFRKVKGDEPDYTAYREEHVFTFAQAGTTWVLANQQPLISDGIPPITEPINPFATGDPSLIDAASSSIYQAPGKLVDGKGIPSGITPMAIPPGLNYTAMVNYAVKFWDNYNPTYRSFAGSGGDCTNFISQIMREGGWTFVLGLWNDDTHWWYNALNQTHSWAGAQNWANFAPTRTTFLTNIWQMGIADVLQMDFNKDGIKDHSLLVTKVTTSEIYMTYHSTDTLNRPLSELQILWAGDWFYSYRT